MKAPTLETGLVSFSISDVHPSPENDAIYRPVSTDDPEIRKLAASIKTHGLLEPLTVTADGYVVSGHRRLTACRLAGLSHVACRVVDTNREDDPDHYRKLLREHNRQRNKSIAEECREQLIDLDPDQCHARLLQRRLKASKVELSALELGDYQGRSEITDAKLPMLARVLDVLEEMKAFLPISLRAIHYRVLNDPPLRHAGKPKSVYRNDRASYNDLSNLLTRARLIGMVPMGAIVDETRPVTTWSVYPNPGSFIAEQRDRFLVGYYRDYQQSQPHHIEIVGEKLTVGKMVDEVAGEFCIPTTIGRGYSSLPPRAAMAERYRKSGKEKLVLLIVSDHDPDGEMIAQSFARTMRDDFAIGNIHPVKVALTAGQVEQYGLPPSMDAKRGSSNYRRFVEQFGTDAYEQEALAPEDLQAILHEAVESVVDTDLFNLEVERERNDAVDIERMRQQAIIAMGQEVDQ